MFKTLLSKVGWGDLPSNFGYTVGEKVDLPFVWAWELHKGQKRSDGSPVSVFICGKKDLDSAQAAAAKNAEQMSKALRHPNILKSLDAVEVDGGFYLVTEAVVPLLSLEVDEDDRAPAVWGLFQTLDALSFLHSSGFTHGLFGPSAIFVTQQGDYRLGGFELCRKGADSASILASRRRIGPVVSGWPDPPGYLQEGTSPTIGIDLWGAAVMTSYVFAVARSARRGIDFRLNMSTAAQDVPQPLQKQFAELLKPGPLRGRSPIAEFHGNKFFQEHPAVQVMSFLSSLHIKSTEEKESFFERLPTMLEGLPKSQRARQVLPELLMAQRFPGQEAAQVLPAILKIGVQLKEEEFKEKVAPLVAQLFAAPDRAIRFRLLTSLGDMIDNLDEATINDKIFPECINGFTDSSSPIREATVKSLIFFVPRLRPKLVESKLVKLLVKMLQDPEATIRTNTVICCGRISGNLPKSCASQTLAQVLASGLKDPFAPCRQAALHTLLATSSIFGAEELATKLLPGVCHRLIDPDPGVGDAAFDVLSKLQVHLKSLVDERRVEMATEQGGAASPVGQSQPALQPGGWSSWALSSVGSVVGQKLMGSMGPSKGHETSPQGTHGGASAQQPSPPPEPSPVRSSSGGAVLSQGMALHGAPKSSSSQPTSRPAATSKSSSASSLDLGLDEDVTAAGAGWGAGNDDNFWDEFGDDKPSATAAISEAPPPAPKPKAAAPATAAAPAPKKSAPIQAKAPSAEPKPKVVAKASSKDDEDFWKEFDM